MELIAHERADHDVFVVRDNPTNRMAVLIMQGNQLIHGEAVGCFSLGDVESFIHEVRVWLIANRHTAPQHRSGEYRAVALGHAVAPKRAAG